MYLTYRIKEDKEVAKAVSALIEITGWRSWFAKNIVLWRKSRRLPIHGAKAI